MKLTNKIFLIIMLLVSVWGCEQEHEIGRIGTTRLLSIGYEWAELAVYLEKNDVLSDYGVCYSNRTSLPTLNNGSRINNSNNYYYGELHPFEWKTDSNDVRYLHIRLRSLERATTYYWRAFIQAGDLIVYGDVQSFTTQN